ncbi:hypothetical protein H5410_051632 [Solanum commersonii]|uniref:Uncharacterized protein n=1 Tax=Solanum commersonii TaxID=4109 RepID=A0A9J5X0M4_SOLCO|nr:hypothetical protein H5410_051632 [Solanum commersonii]
MYGKIEQEDREARNWFNHPKDLFKVGLEPYLKQILDVICCSTICVKASTSIYLMRDKPIITMLEMIKNKLMKRLHSKRIWIEKYQDKICPKIVKKLNKISNEAVMFKPDYSGGPKVLVNGSGGPYVKKRGRKPKNRKKEPEELEKQKAAKTTKKRARKKIENMKPQKLSKKGFVKGRCSICKEEGHNAKGHYNVLKRVVCTSSNQSPDQTLENVSKFSNEFELHKAVKYNSEKTGEVDGGDGATASYEVTQVCESGNNSICYGAKFPSIDIAIEYQYGVSQRDPKSNGIVY